MPPTGDPDALLANAEQIAGAARNLRIVGEDLEAHARSITTDWSGSAAPLALARISGNAEEVRRAAEAVGGVVGPLRAYADALRAAQRDVALGEQQRAQAAVIGQAPPGPPTAVPDGQAVMETAAERSLVANEAAARAFRAAEEALGGVGPATPGQAASVPDLGAALAEAGNIAASLGNAALHHPASTFAVVGGGVIAGLSAAGVVGGAAAMATGVGAPVGVPISGASLAGLAAGAGLAGAGAVDLTQHALGDDRATPFQVDADAGARGWPAESASDRIVSAGVPGRSRRVREVETEDGLTDLYDELAADSQPLDRPSYDGAWARLPDGTEIGIRADSLSGGRTLDARLPNGERWRIHINQP